MQRRARPVDWITANVDAEGHVWFYFDISHERRCKKAYMQEKNALTMDTSVEN